MHSFEQGGLRALRTSYCKRHFARRISNDQYVNLRNPNCQHNTTWRKGHNVLASNSFWELCAPDEAPLIDAIVCPHLDSGLKGLENEVQSSPHQISFFHHKKLHKTSVHIMISEVHGNGIIPSSFSLGYPDVSLPCTKRTYNSKCIKINTYL